MSVLLNDLESHFKRVTPKPRPVVVFLINCLNISSDGLNLRNVSKVYEYRFELHTITQIDGL